jgi:hypothetical protein
VQHLEKDGQESVLLSLLDRVHPPVESVLTERAEVIEGNHRFAGTLRV